MPDIAYVNGTFLDLNDAVIPIDERGHQFGDGIYEVVRVYGGKPFLLHWHIERLLRSAAAIRLDGAYSHEKWVELVEQAVQQSGYAEATVYFQVTRGIAPRAHLFPNVEPSVTLIVRAHQAKKPTAPQKLLLLPDERWANVYIKTLNLLPNVLAKQSAYDAGACEALLVRDGQMLEASSANVWFVKNGELFTAPANRYILPGITRRYVFELAEKLGLTLHEQAVPLEKLHEVDEIFLTSTTAEVLAIDEVIEWPGNIPAKTGLSADIPANVTVTAENCETVWKTGEHVIVKQLQNEFYRSINLICAE